MGAYDFETHFNRMSKGGAKVTSLLLQDAEESIQN